MAAAVTGLRDLLAAHQREADQRDENREAEQQSTIHPKSSKNKVPKWQQYTHAVPRSSVRQGRRITTEGGKPLVRLIRDFRTPVQLPC